MTGLADSEFEFASLLVIKPFLGEMAIGTEISSDTVSKIS
jgi:hypothetical protein